MSGAIPWQAAFEEWRVKKFGRHNPCPIDCVTAFGAGYNAALASEREACADIALAIDSGRGNEKEIANAIRARAPAGPGPEKS